MNALTMPLVSDGWRQLCSSLCVWTQLASDRISYDLIISDLLRFVRQVSSTAATATMICQLKSIYTLTTHFR